MIILYNNDINMQNKVIIKEKRGQRKRENQMREEREKIIKKLHRKKQ